MPGPIHGVKVLELAQIMAGPTCGLMLAESWCGKLLKSKKFLVVTIPEDFYLRISMEKLQLHADEPK